MRCPSCGHENRETAKFCEDCAAPLKQVCPDCSRVHSSESRSCADCASSVADSPGPAVPKHDPRAYTPRHLADRILTSRSALEGERKQITVLFADLKGSMDLAERIDPEEWYRVMDQFFMILANGVHRFEGTVNQYTGDGVMALFGAPIAHEDHAQRACYAALHLTDELRSYADDLRLKRNLNFTVRMGINSGEVVVGKIGDDLRMDYTAQGHTVGLAARMEQIAAPDRINLTQHTAHLVEGFFLLRDLGPLAVKGVQDPLRVFELHGVGPLRTRLDVSRARGFSKFVGRTDDMAILEAALERAMEGKGQVVGVVGEAGVGKSRLCYEFIQRCHARGLMVNESHGIAHGKAMPFLPMLEFLRGYFGITDKDTDETARDKIAGRSLRLDEHLSDGLPLLFDSLGVPDSARPAPRMDPEARQRQLFGILRKLLKARSRRQPAVMLLEDLHWIDGATEAFLKDLVAALPGTRTLLMVNFRPDYSASWLQRSYYQQLPLAPLGPEAITELLCDLLGRDPSIEGLANRIREHTGGNPFFIEEMVQSLIEAGNLEGGNGAYRLARPVDEVAVPASVQAVLAARIDRLDEREKQVLQTASVIGESFSKSVLKGVAELAETDLTVAIGCLQRGEFIYEEALYPETVYAFKHTLTREVAYRSQLSQRRMCVHAAVARRIAELHPDRLDEQAAPLAHHWEEAGDALEAARWHSRAARWTGTSHLPAALGHWRKVRALLEKIPESSETMRLGASARIQILNLGWRLGAPEEEAAVTFAEGKALAERSGDLDWLVRLMIMYGNVRGFTGRGKEYLAHVMEAARLADQTDDAGLKLACRSAQLVAHWYAGRLREAVVFGEQALTQNEEDPKLGADVFGFSPYILALWMTGNIASTVGRHHEAEAALDRAVELSRKYGDTENLGWAEGAYTRLARNTGRAQSALGHAHHAVEIAEKIGSPFSRVIAYERLGFAHILSEEWSQAASALDQALRMARETRTNLLNEARTLATLAEAHLGLGDYGRARSMVDEAVTVAHQRGTKFFECLAQLSRARVLLRTEGAEASGEILRALRKTLELVEETGCRSQEPFIHEELAQLAHLTGDQDTHQRELHVAHHLFANMGATGHAERLAVELGL